MEQEIRLKVDDFTEIRKSILKENMDLVGHSSQLDEYYSNFSLCEKLGRGFLLRVRYAKDLWYFTYKGATGEVGVYDEHETKVEDGRTIIVILEKSGFEKVITVKKERETFRLENASINLDIVEGLGKFIELEIISVKPEQKALKSLTERLKISDFELVRKGYVSLLLEKNGSKYSKYINE